MPFTPLHMGPGAALKLIGGGTFSLLVFGFAQVLIDLEPLIRLYRGDEVLHGPSHTYLGATLIAAVAMVIGKPLFEWFLRDINETRKPGPFRNWKLPQNISWTAAASGAFVGTYSHIVLDSVMHADIHPWAPLSEANRLYMMMPIGWLHLFCLAAGVFALMGFAVIALWRKVSIEVP